MLERKHIGKIEAIPEAVAPDFPNAFAPKRFRQMAVPYFCFRVEYYCVPDVRPVSAS